MNDTMARIIARQTHVIYEQADITPDGGFVVIDGFVSTEGYPMIPAGSELSAEGLWARPADGGEFTPMTDIIIFTDTPLTVDQAQRLLHAGYARIAREQGGSDVELRDYIFEGMTALPWPWLSPDAGNLI